MSHLRHPRCPPARSLRGTLPAPTLELSKVSGRLVLNWVDETALTVTPATESVAGGGAVTLTPPRPVPSVAWLDGV